MDVSSIASTASKSTSSTSSTSIAKDEFLQILVAQLKYQDPLEPLKPDQFLTQLSQLTQVEQLTNITTALENLNTTSNANSLAQWFAVLGKKMNVESSTLSAGDEVQLQPAGSYDEITLTVKNLTDGTTNTVTFKPGDNLTYTNNEGGDVSISVSALLDGKAVTCAANVFRIVKSIEVGDKGLMLVAGNGDGYYLNQVGKITL
jgi:flagellar hook assembly protein FlgD